MNKDSHLSPDFSLYRSSSTYIAEKNRTSSVVGVQTMELYILLAIIALAATVVFSPSSIKEGFEEGQNNETQTEATMKTLIDQWIQLKFDMEDAKKHPTLFAYFQELTSIRSGPILQLEGCIGLAVDEVDNKRLDSAPFMSYTYTGSNTKAIDDQLEYLLTNLSKTDLVQGPVYVLLSSKQVSKDIDARYLFPSYTKREEVQLNLDTLARSHRWLYRILNTLRYKIPLRGKSKGDLLQCAKVCPLSVFDASASAAQDLYYCGCTNCRKPSRKAPPEKSQFYTVYRLNQAAVRFSKYFAPTSRDSLQVNVLPSNFKLEEGCRNMLVSPNGTYVLLIIPETGLCLYKMSVAQDMFTSFCYAHNALPLDPGQGELVWTIPGTGANKSVLVSPEGDLTFSGEGVDGQEIVYKTISVSSGTDTGSAEIKSPICLLLQDDGQLVFVDGNNNIHPIALAI